MKQIVLIILGVLLGFSSQSQISFEATDDYGRLQDITYDPLIPNKLYALSNAGNHILVSQNNMTSWEVLFSFPNADAKISKLKLLGGNAAISFLVTNTSQHIQDGVHIYNLTSNIITNYYPIPNLSDNPEVVSYDVYNANGTHVLFHDTFIDGFVGIPVAKVFYTSNSGTTWDLVYSGQNNDNVNVNNVAFSPNNPNKLFISRSFSPGEVDGGLLISENSGATWIESLPGIVLEPIAFNPTNANDIIIGTAIAFGTTSENLYRSLDGGLTWNAVPNLWTGEIFNYNNINKIVFNPSNPNNIIVLEENEIAVTFNGGSTWTNTVYTQDDSNGYYFGLNASFNPFTAGEVAISTPYYPQFSTNSGINITQIQAPFYNVPSVSSGLYGSVGHLYYGAQGGRIHKNLQTGIINSFQTLNSFKYSLPKNYVIADPVVAGRVFSFYTTGFFGGSLYMSTDYGVTNVLLFTNFADDIRTLTVDPNNSNVIYVSFRYGEGSNVQRINFSDVNNITATEITIPGTDTDGLGNGVVTGIAISSTNSQIIYLAQKEKFYKSSDGGITWEERIKN